MCLVENVQAFVVRFAQEDPDGAAAHGIGPLKLGVMAPLHAIFDLGCGVFAEKARDPEWQLEVMRGIRGILNPGSGVVWAMTALHTIEGARANIAARAE